MFLRSVFLRISFLILFFSFNPFAISASDQEPVISSIRFEDMNGNRIKKKDVGIKIFSVEGRPFSKSLLNDDIKVLYKKFSVVEPIVIGSEEEEEKHIKIIYKLTQRPKIESITIKPKSVLSHVSQDKILEKFDANVGDFFDKDNLDFKTEEIKNFLNTKGYSEASVDVEHSLEKVGNETAAYVYLQIHLGPQYYIRTISIKGISEDEELDFKKNILTKEFSPIFSRLSGYGYYFPRMIERDKHWLISYLRDKGYADCSVYVKTIFSNKHSVKLIFDVSKGDRYFIKNVHIDSDNSYKFKELLDKSEVRSMSIFSPSHIRSGINSIRRYLGSSGHVDPIISIKSKLASFSQRLYDIDMKIEEGGIYKVGRVRITGNLSTDTDLILRKCLLVPGDVCDSIRIEQTKFLLMRTGLFESVDVYTSSYISIYDDHKELVIEVKEKPTGSLAISASKNINEGWQLSLQLSENNFNVNGIPSLIKDGFGSLRGSGQHASASCSIGTTAFNNSLSFFNPSINKSKWGWGFNVSSYQSMRGHHQIGISQDSIKSWLSRAINFNDSVEYSVRFAKMNSKAPDRQFNPTVDEIKIFSEMETEVCGQCNILAFGCNFLTNRMKKLQHPMNGWKSHFSSEILYWSQNKDMVKKVFTGIKLYTSSSLYVPIKFGTVKLRLDGGCILPAKCGIETVPYTERFFGNDPTYCRGWKSNSVGERFISSDGSESSNSRGGDLMGMVSGEYAMPITSDFDLFLFSDLITLHTIFDFSQTLRPKHGNLQTSIGYGLRVHSFMGMPLSVGFGYPIMKPKRENDVSNFFFSLSGSF